MILFIVLQKSRDLIKTRAENKVLQEQLKRQAQQSQTTTNTTTDSWDYFDDEMIPDDEFNIYYNNQQTGALLIQEDHCDSPSQSQWHL